MAEDGSEGEFERFLQEDDDSASSVDAPRKPPRSSVYSISSASAVTSAAAALLASTKFKKHKSKSKSKSKSKRSEKKSKSKKNIEKHMSLSDSEGPLPSYYASSSTKADALLASDADPYTFDMGASFHLGSQDDVGETARKWGRKENERRKEEKKLKEKEKKAAAKSMPISLNDRMAEILKRTGSTQFQGSLDDEARDGQGEEFGHEVASHDSNERSEAPVVRSPGDERYSKRDEDRRDARSEDESGLLDSLGIDSADFEVRLPAKAKLDRPRASAVEAHLTKDSGEDKNDAKSDGRSSRSDSLRVNSADFEVRLPAKANSEHSKAPASRNNREDDYRVSKSDADRDKESSVSDSLGINSADFEVRVAAKAAPEPSRLSLSSLKSEKFSVNVDALGDTELATPSRYDQHQPTFFQSEKGDDSDSNGNYEDEDFELDQTATGVVVPSLDSHLAASLTSEEHKPDLPREPLNLEQGDARFVSEFEKMKDVLMADPVSSTAADSNANVTPGDNEIFVIRGDPSADFDAGSDNEEMSSGFDASGNFGYDDEDFEEDEESRQENMRQELQLVQEVATSSQTEKEAARESADYDYDEFEADQSVKAEDQENAAQASMETSQAIGRDFGQESADYDQDDFEVEHSFRSGEQRTCIEPTAQPAIEAEFRKDKTSSDDTSTRDARLAALLSEKYGDFYADDDEDGEKTSEAVQPNGVLSEDPPFETENQQPEYNSEAEMTVAGPAISTTPVSAKAVESPPSSPPPPPPPEDEEDHNMPTFALEPTRVQATVPEYAYSAPTALKAQVRPTPAADRFQQIESQVASLRFLHPSTSRSAVSPTSRCLPAAEFQAAEATDPVHPAPTSMMTNRDETAVPSVEPPAMAPLAISFDLDLLAREEEENQSGINEFLRRSQILRQSQRGLAVRASIARENELVLRLQQAQRQILQLKTFIQKAEDDDQPVVVYGEKTTPPKPKVADVGVDEGDGDVDFEPVKAPAPKALKRGGATVAQLQKEIKTQDTLIAAFQKENERVMRQLKQVQQDVQYDVHQANEDLRRQVKQLQEQVGNASPPAAPGNSGGDDGFQSNASKAQYRVAVEARLEAEANALALQEELVAVRLAHQQKVNELNLELDRVKKAKVELECRYEGVDLKQVAHDVQQTRELQTELSLCKKEHAHALAALQKKLDWYVENQRLLDDQDDELRRLRKALAENETADPTSTTKTTTPKPSPARSHRRSPADIRRIRELESRLADLEEAMRRRHPDSLANLIQASRRADEEEKSRTMEKEYEGKLAAMAQELEQAHKHSEMRLASFRQQQEKLLLQFRRKLKEQDKQLKQLNRPGQQTHTAASKKDAGEVNDGELQRMRKFYTGKIKELERKWEAKYRAQRKQQFSGLGRADAAQPAQGEQQNLSYADSVVVIANLQKKLRMQELELKKARAKLQQPPTLEHGERGSVSSNAGGEELAQLKEQQTPQSQPETKREELEERVKNLEAQLRDSEDARGQLVQTLGTVQKLGPSRQSTAPISTPTGPENPRAQDAVSSDLQSFRVIAEMQAELVQLHQELATAREMLAQERLSATEKTTMLEAQTREQSEKNTRLQTQLAANLGEVHRLQTLRLDAERHSHALTAQAQRIPELEQEALALRRELELPRTPSMVQYRTLALQVATLEQKHQLREAELKVVLDRALASGRLDKLSTERAHRAALAAKNAEIAAFKRQLEDILAELAVLQLPQSTRPSLFHTRSEDGDYNV